MKITLCGSIVFSAEMIEIARELRELGHEVFLPVSTDRIDQGEVSLEEWKEEKEQTWSDQKMRDEMPHDPVKTHFDLIEGSDAVLAVNIEKKGTPGYIGGSAMAECMFAYYRDKKVFYLNDIPDMPYRDELVATNPIVIHGDLTEII